MIIPIKRFSTDATPETCVGAIVDMFENNMYESLPAFSAKVSNVVVDLEGLFVVCQINPECIPNMTRPFQSERYLDILSGILTKERTIPSVYMWDMLEDLGSVSMMHILENVAPSMDHVDIVLKKYDRRKRTVYMALIASKADPNHVTVIAFTNQRKGARIAFFNDILALVLRRSPTVQLGGVPFDPSQLYK